MFYTIIAAVIFIVSSGLLAYNLFIAQNIEVGNFFDRQYVRESNSVTAEIEAVSIVGKKQYAVTCVISDTKSVDIDVNEERLKRLRKCDKLYLMEFNIPKGKLYCISPLSDIGISGVERIRLHSYGGDEAEELDKKARAFQKIGMALLALAFFTCPSTPLTSIVLSVLSGIISVSVVPLLPWTRAKGFGIIKTESQKSKDKAADSKVPVGYSDWSDTNKELFSIEQRVRSQVQETPESRDLTDRDVDEGPEQEVAAQPELQGDPVRDHLAQTEAVLEKPPVRYCKNCNHLVSDEAVYCELCGRKLSEDIETLPKENTTSRENQEEQQENHQGQIQDISLPDLAEQEEKNDIAENAGKGVHKEEPKQQSNYKQRRRRRKPAVSNEIADMINDIANQE